MSYDAIESLNDIDVGLPVDGATPQELLLAFRQLKAVVKNALLTSHHPDGRLRSSAMAALGANSVITTAISANAVTTEKLADASVTEDKLFDGAVTAGKIGAGAVTEDSYATDSIPTSAFKDNSITLEKLSGLVTGNLISGHPTNDALRAVTANSIANNAVTNRTIADVAVQKLTGGSMLNTLVKIGDQWTPVPIQGALSFDVSALAFTMNSGLSFAVFGEFRGRGLSGGLATTNTWVSRTVSEASDLSNIMTVVSNQFRLLKGTYFIYIQCPAYQVGRHQARLKNVTEATIAAWGSSASSLAAQGVTSHSVICAVLEVASSDHVFMVEHWVQTAATTNDFGLPSTSDNATVYSNHVEIYTVGFAIKLN